jgi:uncharacterized protein
MSASQDNDMAAIALGLLHLSGRLSDKNPAEAARLLAGPASRGNPTAQYRLGLLYLEGQGVAHSAQRARTWLTEAARQGHKDATIALKRIVPVEAESLDVNMPVSSA